MAQSLSPAGESTLAHKRPQPQWQSGGQVAMLEPMVDEDSHSGGNWKLMTSGTNRMGPPLPSDRSLQCPEGQRRGTSSTGETLEPEMCITTRAKWWLIMVGEPLM